MITIMYPTRNRPLKLARSIDSIFTPRPPENPIEIVVVCDGDRYTAMKAMNDDRISRVVYLRDHSGSVYARNLISQTTEGDLICAVDDITFEADAIDAAAATMEDRYPDHDGVVGFRRADRDHTKMNKTTGMYGGVALIGQKFMRRYPNRKICFPGYFLFAAQEITNLAVKLGKGTVSEGARIFHHSPRKGGGMDQTHVEGREYRKRDRDLRKARASHGLIWGFDFEGQNYDLIMGTRQEETDKFLRRRGKS